MNENNNNHISGFTGNIRGIMFAALALAISTVNTIMKLFWD